MTTTSVQDVSDLQTINDTGHRSPAASGLTARMFTAEVRLPLLKYDPVMQAAYEQAATTLLRILQAGYRPYLNLTGLLLDERDRANNPNYALSAQPTEAGLLSGERVEITVQFESNYRVSGLYTLAAERLLESCIFLTKNGWSMVALSSRTGFMSVETCTELEKIAWRRDNGDLTTEPNWIKAAQTFGPRGDVVLVTRGRFDDLDRSIVLVFDPAVPLMAQLFPPLDR